MGIEFFTRGGSGKSWRSLLSILSSYPITPAQMPDGAARSVLGVSGAAAATRADIVASADGDVLQRQAGVLVFAPLGPGASKTVQATASKLTASAAPISIVVTAPTTAYPIAPQVADNFTVDPTSAAGFTLNASIRFKARNSAAGANRKLFVKVLFGTVSLTEKPLALTVKPNKAAGLTKTLAINLAGVAADLLTPAEVTAAVPVTHKFSILVYGQANTNSIVNNGSIFAEIVG